jgi:hypothetical protein
MARPSHIYASTLSRRDGRWTATRRRRRRSFRGRLAALSTGATALVAVVVAARLLG